MQYRNYTATVAEFTVVQYDKFSTLILHSHDTHLVIAVRASHRNLRRGGHKSSPTDYIYNLEMEIAQLALS